MRAQGFLFLEILLAMGIICLALVPMTQNLTASLKSGGEGTTMAQTCYLAQAKMEELLALDFTTLADANGTSIMGENASWRVYVSLYDGDGDSNPDQDLKHIRLQVEDAELETLRFRIP